MNNLLSRFNTGSFVILILVGGVLYLAIVDRSFRVTFGDLAKIGIGGYLGQLIPREDK
ncbi:hypothetical protein [Aliterella atlantica]|uniref:hypothetical protein n=1 Tax=Aliterella atlantica TaxID=1827278 RepID=UPI00136493F5|nr:hypothetical protein [Aliterella atlantica]